MPQAPSGAKMLPPRGRGGGSSTSGLGRALFDFGFGLVHERLVQDRSVERNELLLRRVALVQLALEPLLVLELRPLLARHLLLPLDEGLAGSLGHGASCGAPRK